MSNPELEDTSEKRLRTNKVEPDFQAVTDRSTQADKVVGFARDSFKDSYRDLELPVLPQGELKRARELRDDLERVEQGTV